MWQQQVPLKHVPNYIASHPRGQTFIAKDSHKSHICVQVLCGNAGVESSAKTIGQHQGDGEDI
jgi:hypothetical protein